jgi:geranylgeranyl reductase family protein
MDDCDVLIVGGGPAGSSCAWRLRRAGVAVTVLDRARFPRDKPCAGWITPGVLAALELDPAEYSRQHVMQPITGFRTGVIGSRAIETRYGRAVSYGIRRCEFDHFLLRRSGARLLAPAPAERIERAGGSWLVNGRIRARILVGAGGHFCPVARMLGAVPSAEHAVVAREAEFEIAPAAHPEVDPELPELWFCEDFKGYGWLFRKGDYLNVGLGRLDREHLPEHFSRFLRAAAHAPQGLPVAPRGHAYLVRETCTRRVADGGVLLIGDAAGLAAPASGEGIRAAVESGLLAAEAILEGAAGIARYPARLAGRFGPAGAGGRSYPPALIRLLMRSRWFTRHILLDRRFLAS